MSAATRADAEWLVRHGGKFLASVVIAGSFVWLLHKGALPLAPERASFARMRWWTLGVYVAIYCAIAFIRGGRWSFLLAPIARVPLVRVLCVSFIGFAAIVLLPLRAGEAVRPLLIREPGKLSGWAAAGTIAAERVLDGLVLSLLLLAGLALSTPQSPLPDHIGNLPISPALVPRAAYGGLGLFATAFTVLGVFYARRAWARSMTERVVGAISPRLAGWLADRVEHVADGLRFLPSARVAVPFVAMTVVYWLLNALGTWLIAWGVGFDGFTLSQACVTTGVVALGIMVPSGPGFFGTYQFSFYAALAVYYPPELVTGPGAACVFVIYCAQIVLTILAAILGAAIERPNLKEALSAGAPSSDAENLAQRQTVE
jgi:hypothetical protein